MSAVMVKQLEWSEPSPPKEGVSYYDHCDAETPFGFYRIEWKGWKDYPSFGVDSPSGYIGTEGTLSGAKMLAQADFTAKVSASLSQSPSLPTPAATPTDSANPPPVESVGPNSEAQS